MEQTRLLHREIVYWSLFRRLHYIIQVLHGPDDSPQPIPRPPTLYALALALLLSSLRLEVTIERSPVVCVSVNRSSLERRWRVIHTQDATMGLENPKRVRHGIEALVNHVVTGGIKEGDASAQERKEYCVQYAVDALITQVCPRLSQEVGPVPSEHPSLTPRPVSRHPRSNPTRTRPRTL